MKTMSFKEMQKLSRSALLQAVVERRRALFSMRLTSKSDAKSVKPDVLRGIKTEIARLKTVYTLGDK